MYDTTEKFNSLKSESVVTVLGIESSCDETAAAVVVNGRDIRSNVIASQVPVHRRFGGVVPEVASRNHTMAVNNVVDEALKTAGVTIADIDAIAVTYGAGLVGALLVGVTAAKALSFIPMFLTGVMTEAANAISSVSFAVKQAAITPLACLFVYLACFAISDRPLVSPSKKYAACAASLFAAVLCML